MSRFAYSLRPAKYIVRRLLCEAFRKLGSLAPLPNYQYVGFGGIEFTDFVLIHRELGITKLISVEGNTAFHRRAVFNVPFSAVELYEDTFTQVMTRIEWGKPSIVWLDYQCFLGDTPISDVSFLASELQPGSLLVVTLAAKAPPDGSRRDTLSAAVGEERVPPGATEASLDGWGFAEAQRDGLLGVLDQEFARRRDNAWFEQLFDFGYRDGAAMQTCGGIVVSHGNENAVSDLHFDDLSHSIRRRGAEMLIVRVPVVTLREALHLNRQLPLAAGAALSADGITREELVAYETFYRWYPSWLSST